MTTTERSQQASLQATSRDDARIAQFADPAYIRRMKALNYWEQESWDSWIEMLEEMGKVHREYPERQKEDPDYVVGPKGTCQECWTEMPHSGICGNCEG